MSSKTRNRGKEGRDDLLFGKASAQEKLLEAVSDLSFLLEKGYGVVSACQLVGNRYKLNKRQQQALRGMSASETSVSTRMKKLVDVQNLKGQTVIVDGFNVLIILESMLSGGYIFKGKDGAYRDLSSIHGSYKKVSQTQEAIMLVGDFFMKYHLEKLIWVFDKPVSNSGKMKAEILEIANEKGWNWEGVLDFNPDKLIAQSEYIAVSSDAWILENASKCYNMIEDLISENYTFLIDVDGK